MLLIAIVLMQSVDAIAVCAVSQRKMGVGLGVLMFPSRNDEVKFFHHFANGGP